MLIGCDLNARFSDDAAIVFQDNQSVIALANRGAPSHRTKHIKIRNFFLKEQIDLGIIDIVYKETGYMIADALTKPLQGSMFRRFKDLLLGGLLRVASDNA